MSKCDLKEELNLENFKAIRPKATHNQILLAYILGENPPEETVEEEILPCPFLNEKGLCKCYHGRPLMCRIMVSLEKCEEGKPANIPPFLFKIGLVAMQLVENIDQGGIYGNFVELLTFLKKYKQNKTETIPDYFLNNIFVDELPLLPQEMEERKWVGELYRTPIKDKNLDFRELLNHINEEFKKQKNLTFLDEIFSV